MKSCKGILTNMGNGYATAKKKRNNFPYVVKKIQKYLQRCMKSSKGIKTNLGNFAGEPLVQQKKTKQIILCCEENAKISSMLYEKL